MTEEYIISHFSGIGGMDLSVLVMIDKSPIKMSDPDAISCWGKLKKRLYLYALPFILSIILFIAYGFYRALLLH